ncbi:tripartite tricarboxylate transporter permease [Jiangella asiatica]|uniref:Tripartite tricarboxylate transporter permease n=1 Tax=Jiangella asiatica TaxID=2530372 RepID=A0A4R5DTL0_9ACTN|nr:tripartite tricarboxylate transporter permease [Jiangella asiatica]TDE14233.1 tripartite tricarboxylate transporter permease [Jiangella asiatica]
MTELLDGFTNLASLVSIGALFLGVLVGTVVGVLPGIGPIGAMAVLLPISYTLDPAAGLLMLAGIYFGSMYGGSTTSILMRVPGEGSSVVTSIDGYEMTKRGRAGAALVVAAVGSFIAGTLVTTLLLLVAPSLSDLALRFSAPEFLALGLFAVLVLSRLTSTSLARSMVALGFGLALSTIGFDSLTGTTRLDFGSLDVAQGVDLTAVAVGLFGIAEIFFMIERSAVPAQVANVRLRDLYPTRTEWRRSVPAMFRGSAVGFGLGLTPGPSAVLSTYASYWVERRVSRRPEEFGKGAIEGVAGPESANNGASGATLIPLLVLGIPFAPPAALLLSGLTVHGVIPGPEFITQQSALFFTLVAGMYAANLMLLILNFPLVGLFTRLLSIPRDVLIVAIVMFAVVGVYAIRLTTFDMITLVVMGLVGWAMAKLGIPRVTVILAFVLGPRIESSLVQSLQLAHGDPAYFLGRPIALVIFALTAVAFVVPAVVQRRRARVAGGHQLRPARKGR